MLMAAVSGTHSQVFSVNSFPIRLCLADLQYVNGLGELTGAPRAAAELAQDLPVLSWAFARSPGARSRGILNVASTAAFQPGPNSAVYYATKAYVLSFTEALAEEVRGSGMQVPAWPRGPTETGFAAQAGAAGSRLFRRGVMDAVCVARAGHDGLRRVRLWSFPACVTAPWRLARACPRAALSPRSPATYKAYTPAPEGSSATPGLWPRPAATNPAPTGSSRTSGHCGTGPLHSTLHNEPSPRAKAHTAAVICALILVDCLVMEAAPNGLVCTGQCGGLRAPTWKAGVWCSVRGLRSLVVCSAAARRGWCRRAALVRGHYTRRGA